MSNLARQQPLEPSMKYKFVCVVFTLQYQISRGWAPPKWTPPSPKNWRQNTGNNAIFPDLGGSIWQGLNQGEIYNAATLRFPVCYKFRTGYRQLSNMFFCDLNRFHA